MSRLKKFWKLSGAEKKTFMVALSGLPTVYLKLRLYGFKETLSRLQRIPLAEIYPEIDPVTYPAQTSLVVNTAARLLFHREACLERSLLLWSLLRRKGIESELKIGVETENTGIRAHAWIEINGEPVNEQPKINEEFAAFNSSFTADYKDFS